MFSLLYSKTKNIYKPEPQQRKVSDTSLWGALGFSIKGALDTSLPAPILYTPPPLVCSANQAGGADLHHQCVLCRSFIITTATRNIHQHLQEKKYNRSMGLCFGQTFLLMMNCMWWLWRFRWWSCWRCGLGGWRKCRRAEEHTQLWSGHHHHLDCDEEGLQRNQF